MSASPPQSDSTPSGASTSLTREVLILFAHPALEKSRVNKRLIEGVASLDHVTVHDLYEAYPDFDVDVGAEQALLLGHQVILFHHPFYWYSSPALLKEWQDLVLQHGWAYGRSGRALCNKLLLSVITTGAREETYRQGDFNRFSVAEFLRPIEQLAHLCGMKYLPPFAVHGTHELQSADIAAHAEEYRRLIIALRDGRLDLEAARREVRLNASLDQLITEE